MATSVLQGIQVVVGPGANSVISRANSQLEIVSGAEFFDIYYFNALDSGLGSEGGFGASYNIRVDGAQVSDGFGPSASPGLPTIALVELSFAGGVTSTVIFTRALNDNFDFVYSFFLVDGAPIPSGPLSAVRNWFDSIIGISVPAGEFAPDLPLAAPTFDSFVSFTHDDLVEIAEERFGRYRLGIGDDTFIGSDAQETFNDGRFIFDYEYLSLNGVDIRTREFEGDEVVYGGDGNDDIRGRGGRDFLSGDAGNDTLRAGTVGDDQSSFGEDVLFGGDGNDDLYGSTVIRPLDYSGALYGDAGNDRIFGGNGIDDIGGGAGNDTVAGGDGGDYIGGHDGRDRMAGGRGNDLILGHAGNDNLSGDGGADQLDGGIGNDTLTGGIGRDLLIGGAGADRFVFAAGSGRDTVLDLNIAEGDRLQIAASLLGAGIDTAQEIVDAYGAPDAAGVRLAFDTGDVIRLVGVTDLAALSAGILIV